MASATGSTNNPVGLGLDDARNRIDVPESPRDATADSSERHLPSRGSGPVAASVDNSPASINSPPYWLRTTAHQRTVSAASVESVLPVGAITLRDNETSEHNERNSACWAKSVEITDYTIVHGAAANAGLGAFVVYNIKVETLNGSYMNIRKRYSEFDEFRNKLVQSFPRFEKAMPELPPKSVISKFRPRFLEKRRTGLQYFLNCVLLNPEFSGSPVLKDFLFS